MRCCCARAGAILVITAVFLPSVSWAASNEAAVREYFSATPVMIAIARCESEFTQFDDTGTFLRGGMGKKMIGVFQIYEDIHAEYARRKGIDIYTLEGNLAYAKHLYEREGTRPWDSSSSCWENHIEARVISSDELNLTSLPHIQPAPENIALTDTLRIGMEDPQVTVLQRLLNEKGYRVAESGPGSPGFETLKFGALTLRAVRAYQCAEGIVCEGDESSSGYGLVGARTRAALQARTVTAPPSVAPTATQTTTLNDTDAQIRELHAQIEHLTKVLSALQSAPQN